jgi:type IV secretory pathway VirB4 component
MTYSLFEEALSKNELFAKALFERPESLSEFLPYEEFLPEFGLFRQKDGSLGCVYSVELSEHEVRNSQEIISLLERLKNWFRLTEEYTLSLLFEQSRISAYDPLWESLTSKEDKERDDIPSNLHLAQIKRLRESADSEERALRPLKRRLFLSIRYFGKKSSRFTRTGQLGRQLLDPNRTLSFELEAFVKHLRSFNYILSQIEMSSPLTLKRLDAAGLADFLRQTFNPVTYFKRPFASVNPKLSLSDQVIFCSAALDYTGIEREGIKSRTISLKNAPSFAYPGAMAYFLSLKFPFRICLNISFPSTSSIKKHFGVKDFFLQNTPTARSRRQKSEINDLQEKLVRDDKVLQMTFFVLVEGASEEELDIQTKECLVRFQRRLECEALVENEIGFGLWLNALPLNYHPIADYTSKRSIRILASDIVYFCPVFDSFRGSSPASAQSLFLSREDGLVPFGLKATGNSHMTAVLGDTGSAKSGQVIKLLLGELRREPRPMIFVIDYKTSYGMLSQYLPSEMTSFERGKPMPFSPFRGELNEDKIRFLVQLLASAMLLTSPQFELESEHRTCLSQAIQVAYRTKTQSAGVKYEAGQLVESTSLIEPLVTLDDIIAALGGLTAQVEFEKYGQFVDEIAKKLRPFYSDGIYAPFFKNTVASKVDQKADLFVYDLDALAGDPILQSLVTMSVIEARGLHRHRRTGDAGKK